MLNEQRLPWRIGHRGAKGYVAENTIASIKKALELGVNAIEIDVRLAKTKELVVFHDETTDRLTSKSANIKDLSLSEIQKLKIENLHFIPTLRAVLEVVNKTCVLNIELKTEDAVMPCITEIENSILYEQWAYSHFIISSFHFKSLERLRLLNSKIPLAVLSNYPTHETIKYAKQIKACAVHLNYKHTSAEMIKAIQKEGLKVNVFTVNLFRDIDNMKKLNVDGIISDYPDRV